MIVIDTRPSAGLAHSDAMALQAAELQRTLALLRSLDGGDWAARTDCPDWDVRRMYLHVLGACEAGARMRENGHQLAAAWRRRRRLGGPLEAALSAVQVGDREDLDPAGLVARLEAVAPRTVRGRRRIPAFVRNHVRIPVDGPVLERWTLGYLVGTIYLRDLWMHRIDAARATGRAPELTPGHDGRIVADVVREWGSRHGRPFTLELNGPAGGTFGHQPRSPGAENLVLDAVEFCRILAGRAPAAGLLATVVPF